MRIFTLMASREGCGAIMTYSKVPGGTDKNDAK
jgi:hypothetical protein